MPRKPRSSLSKKLRFEVFKRDGFKCQYCGGAAPDVVLEVDHVSPVSKGGKNDILNLITSCRACNSGKSDRELSDDSALVKQRTQLEELNERRNQLAMMIEWRSEMEDLASTGAQAVSDALDSACQRTLTQAGLDAAKKLVKKYGLADVLDAVEIAAEAYKPEFVWSKVAGVLWMRAQPEHVQRAYKLRAWLRRRINYVNDRISISLLELVLQGHDDREVMNRLSMCNSWPLCRSALEDMIAADGAE